MKLMIIFLLLSGTAFADCSTPSCMTEYSIRPKAKDEPRVMPVKVDRKVLMSGQVNMDEEVLVSGGSVKVAGTTERLKGRKAYSKHASADSTSASPQKPQEMAFVDYQTTLNDWELQ